MAGGTTVPGVGERGGKKMKERGSIQIPCESPEGDSFLTVTAGQAERFDELLCSARHVGCTRVAFFPQHGARLALSPR